MSSLAQELLGILDDHGLVRPPAPVPVTPAMQRAAEELVALRGAWDDDTVADRLFSDNVALDEPYAQRRQPPPGWFPPTVRCAS